MENEIYKLVEVVGSSPEGMEAAIRNAIAKAAESVRNIRWFQVTETRGHVENGQIAHFQVTVKIGFTLDNT